MASRGRAKARSHLHACSPWLCRLRHRSTSWRCAPCLSHCCPRCCCSIWSYESEPPMGNSIWAPIHQGRQSDARWIWSCPWRFFIRSFWPLLRPLRKSAERYDHQGVEEWPPCDDCFLRNSHTSRSDWKRIPIHLNIYKTQKRTGQKYFVVKFLRYKFVQHFPFWKQSRVR